MRAAALTLLATALYGAAFPPLAATPLAWIALVPFFLPVTRVSPGRAAGLGLLFTLGLGVTVTWWAPRMLTDFFHLRPLHARAALATRHRGRRRPSASQAAKTIRS